MQATPQQFSPGNGRLSRNQAYFLATPLAACLLLFVALAILLVSYQSQHNGAVSSRASASWASTLARWRWPRPKPPSAKTLATPGATVSVRRLVYNADGQLIEDRTFVSNYIPVPNVYHYGEGVEPYSYDLVPEDDKQAVIW